MKINIYRDFKGQIELVGLLSFGHEEKSKFQYNPEFVKKSLVNKSLGISHKLSLNKEVYYEDEFDPYFRGLLPEGGALEDISRILQVDRSDYKRLLYKLGCESIGALTFVSELEDVNLYKPVYEKISKNLIQQLQETPVKAIQMNVADIRLSLSGAQSKSAWYLPANINAREAKIQDWLIPKNTAPSSHIIKVFNSENLDIALNELACSLISKACGIETCDISLLDEIPGVIAIKRFDRYLANVDGEEKLVRLHQEDFCQAMGFPAYAKYQMDGIEVDYLSKMYDLIEEVSFNFREEVNEVAKRTVFNYIIGNSDAHLKNFSLLYNKS